MTLDGTTRASYPWKGVRYDTQIWSMLAPDWKETIESRP
jgi:ribosomal-protein-serine acetyltransferase